MKEKNLLGQTRTYTEEVNRKSQINNQINRTSQRKTIATQEENLHRRRGYRNPSYRTRRSKLKSAAKSVVGERNQRQSIADTQRQNHGCRFHCFLLNPSSCKSVKSFAMAVDFIVSYSTTDDFVSTRTSFDRFQGILRCEVD